MPILITCCLIALTVYLIIKGIDVRLVLMGAALAIAGLSGSVAVVIREFWNTFSNEKFVLPICSAMGFAYVLKHTECDTHLVRLLTNPLRYAQVLLLPGVILVGFMVNIPVISQTSTAVCLGTVVVPLMKSAGVPKALIGATLLLGASIGGELLNPGAPELTTVATTLEKRRTQEIIAAAKAENPSILERDIDISAAKVGTKDDVIPKMFRPVFMHLAFATIIFWWLNRRYQPVPCPASVTIAVEKVNYLRALVPLVPLLLLFSTGAPFYWFEIPKPWVVDAKATQSQYEIRLIGLAMLVGVVVAGIATPKKVRTIPKAFFEGAGYAFAEVVSLIVVANCFGKAIEQVGLAKEIGRLITQAPGLLIPLAGGVPLLFAFISGSGMAATQSLYEIFIDPAQATGANPIDVGAVVSLGAAAGRTMSPVAAVTLMSAKLTETNPLELVKKVSPGLVLSLMLVILLRVLFNF